jgi:hypothetical protein
MTHVVEVHVSKSRHELAKDVYKVLNQQKFSTKQEAEDFATWFNCGCDRNRRAVYVGERD